MGKTISIYITSLLALAGCVVSLVLTWEHYHPQADIGCSAMGGNCKSTVDSAYGHIGPIPTSILGLGMYLVIGGLCFQRLRLLKEQREQMARERQKDAAAYARKVNSDGDPADAAREELEAETGASPPALPAPSPSAASSSLPGAIRRLDALGFGIALLAFGISWWLQYVSIGTLHTFCPWCFSSAILVTLILVLASYGYLFYGRKLVGEQKLLTGVLAFVFVMAAVIAWSPISEWITANLQHAPETGEEAKPKDLQNIVMNRDFPIKGDPNAQLFIVEFADYQCSHCKEASMELDQYMKKNPKKVRLGFRNLPLPSHQWAKDAAISAEAAREQGKFWEMHDFIFEHQQDMDSPGFNVALFDKWAEMLKLNMAKFQKDRNDTKIMLRVAMDQEYGSKTLQIQYTPTFYVFTKNKMMYAFTGNTELQKAIQNPDHLIWK